MFLTMQDCVPNDARLCSQRCKIVFLTMQDCVPNALRDPRWGSRNALGTQLIWDLYQRRPEDEEVETCV